MNGYMNQQELRARLEAHSDAELRTLIADARGILAAREDAQKKEALAEIRRLAKAHGLDVAVKKPVRKRGRPPKVSPEG